MDTTPTRPLVITDEVQDLAPVSSLWAACAMPGPGSEYRFTATRTSGGRLHRAVAAVRSRRARRRFTDQLHRVLDARHRHVNGDRSC